MQNAEATFPDSGRPRPQHADTATPLRTRTSALLAILISGFCLPFLCLT